MVFAELIITFEIGVSENDEIDYNCISVQIETILENNNSHKRVNTKQSIFHDCFKKVDSKYLLRRK